MTTIEKILISACLLGDKVRYDGKSKLYEHPAISKWLAEKRLVKLCPEMLGGLTTPRPAAELMHARGSQVLANKSKVLTSTGADVSHAFIEGAIATHSIAQGYNIKFALLKSNSPSCGNTRVYNGQFDGSLVAGEGVTAALLRQNNILVFNEDEIDKLVLALN